jgi:hypothetical protein
VIPVAQDVYPIPDGAWDIHEPDFADLMDRARAAGGSTYAALCWAFHRALLRVALGIMFFWTLGMMANLNIDQFAFEGGATKQTQVVPLLGAGFALAVAFIYVFSSVPLPSSAGSCRGGRQLPPSGAHQGREALGREIEDRGVVSEFRVSDLETLSIGADLYAVGAAVS